MLGLFHTGLNEALDSHQYPVSVQKDLNRGTCFAKVNLTDTYLKMEIVKDFKKLLIINTYWELFQFSHLSFGVKLVPCYVNRDNRYCCLH